MHQIGRARKYRNLKILVSVFLLICASGCSSSNDSPTNTEEVINYSWYDTIPVGFEPLKTADDSSILIEGFAYKLHERGTFECPKGWKNCRQVAVIAEKGCPNGVFATIVGKLLDYPESEPYMSELIREPLAPNQIRVVKFKLNDAYWNGVVSPIPSIFSLGCIE